MLAHPLSLRRLGLLVLLLGALGAVGVARAASAQQDGDSGSVDLEALREDRRAKASRHPVGRRISRYLEAANEEIQDDKPEEAEKLLLRLDPKRLNPYQRALVNRMLAYIAYTNEAPERAIGYFEKVLAEETLPISDENKIRFSVAQLHAGLEHWSEAITWLDQWLRYEERPDPLGFYLKALAQYQMQEYDASIESIQRAIELADSPREAWLRLLAAIYQQREDYAHATPVLEELLLRFPKKQYWVQLSVIYGVREDYERSLAVQQVAYAQGFLTEDKELRRLVRSYLYNDLPYPAAKILERELEAGRIEDDSDAYELLANSWIAAREYDRSLPPLREAARRSKDGNLYVRLGQVHMQREQWAQAVEALKKALEKGELENRGNAELLLGIAFYNDEHPAEARRYFVRARQYEATRAEAERWIGHLSAEVSSDPETSSEAG